jgi:integrase
LGTQGTITLVSIEAKTANGVTKYRGIAQVKGKKQHTPWVLTRAEAVMLEAELKMSMGGQATRTGHTVGTVVAGYIEACRDGGDHKPDTIAYYLAGQASIPPTFADRLVSTVNPVVVDALYRELLKSGKSRSVTRRLHALLSVSFNRAVKYEWMQSNPCTSVKKPTTETPEIIPPSPTEVRRVIAAAVEVNADLSVALLLGAASGMRRSELVALQWRDLVDGAIIIRRNRVRDGKKFVTRNTKTGTRGHRTIVIDADTLQAVEKVRARQHAAGHSCEWIFTHDGLEPFRPEYLTRSYASLQKDGSSVHDLRHFHATQLLAARVPVTQVSHRLGHSSPSVTMNTYAHWIPAEDQTSADLIGSILH